MSTPFTPITDGTALFSLAIINELEQDIWERYCVRWGRDSTGPLPPAYPPFTVAGADIQSVSFWSSLQTVVLLGLLPSYYTPPNEFLDPELVAAIPETDYWIDDVKWQYTIHDEPEYSWIEYDALVRAGLTNSCFRRFVPSEDPDDCNPVEVDTSIDHDLGDVGRVKKGDIIGPWLIEDIRAVLSVLTIASHNPMSLGLAAEAVKAGYGDACISGTFCSPCTDDEDADVCKLARERAADDWKSRPDLIPYITTVQIGYSQASGSCHWWVDKYQSEFAVAATHPMFARINSTSSLFTQWTGDQPWKGLHLEKLWELQSTPSGVVGTTRTSSVIRIGGLPDDAAVLLCDSCPPVGDPLTWPCADPAKSWPGSYSFSLYGYWWLNTWDFTHA